MPATPLEGQNTPDGRTPTEHDCDRILYSDELRRLGGVTQVVAVGEIPLFHTRLTHTLKVQQLSRRLAEHLQRDEAQKDKLEAVGGVDVAAAEAAGLAHDLGHPPFGHVGEEELNKLCGPHGLDGFEGNAQTLRILAKLGAHPNIEQGKGLGVSDRTLRAVIKYPYQRHGKHEQSGKWNAYPTESDVFNRVREGLGDGERSLEAEIMDWADDVTYAVHDLEDFVRAQHIPIGPLIQNPTERSEFINASWKRVMDKMPEAQRDLVDRETVVANFSAVMAVAFGNAYPQREFQNSREVARGCRWLIDQFVSSVRVGVRPNPLDVPPTIRAEVELFKQLTWHYVIHDPRLATLQEGQRQVVIALFEKLHPILEKAHKAGALNRLPRQLKWAFEITGVEGGSDRYPHPDARYARAVADFIASLTEEQAVDLYQRLVGTGGKSVLDPWMLY
ncbi:dGTP triphosphohydrolase [Mycobacterium europaeum]|uniref:deoxyguanosinetriphosphate triphosphohydrolase family protein n=1 Tax=Mycobacterium europaeum TaxID=761804 RepID=UPI002ADF3F92|nr:dNTP triphosphohydrolase [Mycobacterium europaeum]MEA1159790.1 dNTP triphosphohydrolase [Mycobacterium europaeum]